MKKQILTTATLTLLIAIALILNSCKEDLPEVPLGTNNKIELTLTTDSVSYTFAKLEMEFNYIPNYSHYEAGICYDTLEQPDIEDKKISLGEIKELKENIDASSLMPNTQYFCRAYFKVNNEVLYSPQVNFTTLDARPVIEQQTINEVNALSAKIGVVVSTPDGFDVTKCGVCWGEDINPDFEDSFTTEILLNGTFISEIKALAKSTKYYVRAYATNSEGTSYGESINLTTLDGTPVLTTASLTAITAITATSGGTIANDGGDSITARGVCWATTANPTTADNFTTDGRGTGSFTSNLTALSVGTSYKVRAYATNSLGTFYGNEQSFTTTDGLSVLTTNVVSAITGTTATSGGNISSDGGFAITARGVCWGTSSNPTIADSKTLDGTGTGSFTSSITGLNAKTSYYVRSYATNSVGTVYGNEQSFTTADMPVLTTTAISNITTTSATGGGNIISDGGFTITARGVCWSTTTNPTTADNKTNNGSGIGSFTSSLTALVVGTKYYVRAYATNSAGTFYGNEQTFTTNDGKPILTTTVVTAITATTATSGGSISSDGGVTIDARGVCWATTANPTIANNKTSNGTGTGSFTSSLTGLIANVRYYVRAYATNSVGTSYGDELSFITPMPDGPGSTITDSDGNIYNTIWIGGQLWMAQNLKTTKYNNGTTMPLVTDNTQWANLGDNDTDKAYCYYNNQAINGALYTYAAAKDACPIGWHLPSDGEWTELINYLGGVAVAGGKMKSITGWTSPNTGATNSSGFTALPDGTRRSNDGNWSNVGTVGIWWSSTAGASTNAWSHSLGYNNAQDYRNSILKSNGVSIRCIKD